MPEDCPLGKIYFHTDTVFTRLQRHMKSLERSYKDASQELARLQSGGTDDRLVSSVDSGPPNHPAPPSPEPTPPPAPTTGPPPQPAATEPTYLQIGFVPSTLPSPADPPLSLPSGTQQTRILSAAPGPNPPRVSASAGEMPSITTPTWPHQFGNGPAEAYDSSKEGSPRISRLLPFPKGAPSKS